MCNLTFVKTRIRAVNMAAALELATASAKSNSHGWGLYTHSAWKTEMAANAIANSGICIKAMCKEYAGPIMSHTRQASKSIAVNLENVHPFVFKNVVGMHNGTLWFKDEEPGTTVGDEPRASDSRRFFQLLNDALEDGTSMPDALNAVMKDCKGKFAFLIKDLRDGRYYVCRGASAELNIVDVFIGEERIGFIVNTLKMVLQDSLIRINATAQLAGLEEMLSFGKVEELPKEKIFLVEGTTLKEVANLPENPLPKPVHVVSSTPFTANTGTKTSWEVEVEEGVAPFRELAAWASDQRLSPLQLNYIFHLFTDKNLGECSREDVVAFLAYAKKKLSITMTIENYLNSKFVYTIPESFYRLRNMNFPLANNNPSRIMQEIRKLKEAE